MTDGDQLDLEGIAQEPGAEPKRTAPKRTPARRSGGRAARIAEVDGSAAGPGDERVDRALEQIGAAGSEGDGSTGPLPPLPEGRDEGGIRGAAGSGSSPTDSATPDASSSSSSAESAASEVVEQAPGLYFLTNRMNLNGILSSRMLAPRESFSKYYSDLLEDSPGWVPLLTAPPTAALVERVTAERGAGAPVLLELSDAVVDRARGDGAVFFVHAALMTHVKAIHFRDQRSLREHRARGYSNVHPHAELLRVSPELFAVDSRDPVEITPPPPPTTDWRRLDRVRGAANGMLAAADSGEALALAAGALGAEGIPDATVIPGWLSWSWLKDDGGPESSTELAHAPESGAQADALIFRSAYRILGARDQAAAWSPSEVLESVAADISRTEPSDGVRAVVERSLNRIRELVNVERDFEPFRNPGGPFVAAKALLLVLLRPDLGQLLEWPAEETGADATTRVVAGVLAGRLRGLAREAVRLRNPAFDDITAAWAVRTANGEDPSLGPAEFKADPGRARLVLASCEVRSTPPLVPDPTALYNALGPAERLAGRLAVSRHLAWPVQVRLHLPPDAEVRTEASVITVTSVSDVAVDTIVEEGDFLVRLRNTTAKSRREAAEILGQGG